MEPREIYDLHYQLARCDQALVDWAGQLSRAHSALPLMPHDIFERLEKIQRHQQTYLQIIKQLGAARIDGQMHDEDRYRNAAQKSLYDQADELTTIMERARRRYYNPDICAVRKWQPGIYRRFLGDYQAALVRIETERIRNPSPAQLRYHWTHAFNFSKRR